MLLAIDIGNTNIKLGIFDGDRIVKTFRMASVLNKTADEYSMFVDLLLEKNNIPSSAISGIIIASVIPSLNYTIEHMLEYTFPNIEYNFIGSGVKTGLNIKYDNPKEVGSDRIACAVGALNYYGGPCITVDFGTATTFNCITENAEFLGGCIAPGLKVSVEALSSTASKLPFIELQMPPSIIGRTTVSNLQAGAIYGFIGQVKHIIELIKQEQPMKNAKVIATGGLSELVCNEKGLIDIVDRALTLKGLKIIYDINRKQSRGKI